MTFRVLWIDETDGFNREKAAGFTGAAFSLRRLSDEPRYVDELRLARGLGKSIEVYTDPGWYGYPDEEAYALERSRDLGRLFERLGDDARGLKTPIGVLFDIENHDMEYALNLFLWWRRYRGQRATAWTMEPFQGADLAKIRQPVINLRITLAVQTFLGRPVDMTPACAEAAVTELTGPVNVGWGFPGDRVVPVHDSRRLYAGWRGYAFRQGLLP